MKRALKYGLLVTVIIVFWVALKHFVLHIDPARAAIFDTIIFNVSGILGLSLGIRDLRRANGGSLTFGEGVKTGFSIAVTYALLTSVYFAILLMVIGPKIMQQAGEVGPGNEVTGLVVVKAFAGVLVGLTLVGIILSVIISLVLRKRPV